MEGMQGGSTLLLPSLRAALACLYSLPQHVQDAQEALDGITATERRNEAHSYLMSFQSRNLRRRMKSMAQSRHDSSIAITSSGSTGQVEDEQEGSNIDFAKRTLIRRHDNAGSTWLACLALLCSKDAHPSERLFAVQTLRHRLRRTQIIEAVDIECEDPPRLMSMLHGGHDCQQRWYKAFFDWTAQFHPELHRITFHGKTRDMYDQVSDHDEEAMARIKGELTLLSLSGIAIMLTTSFPPSPMQLNPTLQQGTSAIPPILSTLGAALSLVALRMRYTPKSVSSSTSKNYNTNNNDSNAAIPTSLITTISVAIHASNAAIPSTTSNTDAAWLCMCSALGALPDAIFGSTGGVRGKISLDPRCIEAGAAELRCSATGMEPLLEILSQAPHHAMGENNSDPRLGVAILNVCERWAKFIPLTFAFVDATVELARPGLAKQPPPPIHSPHSQNAPSPSTNNFTTDNKDFIMYRASYSFLISIFEGCALSEGDVLATSIGITSSSSSSQKSNAHEGRKKATTTIHQQNKIKIKSRTKKEERLQSMIANDSTATKAATEECYSRREVACRVASKVMVELGRAVSAELAGAAVDCCANNDADTTTATVDGEGAIGCMCACASACLPHLLKKTTSASSNKEEEEAVRALFSNMMKAFCHLCACSNSSVRRLTHEPLLAFHKSLLTSGNDSETGVGGLSEAATVGADGVIQCTMSLARACAYPKGYFQSLTIDSNQELEIERNDVRDILRTVTSSDICNSASIHNPAPCRSIALRILESIVRACADACSSSNQSNNAGETMQIQLAPEVVVHTLSALGKPLLQLAQFLPHSCHRSIAAQVVEQALWTLRTVCVQLLRAFDQPLHEQVLPVSRLASLATATFAPFFSAILKAVSTSYHDPQNAAFQVLRVALRRTLSCAVRAAAKSLLYLPELAGASTLGESSLYDIRGAMRAPGGEDHVGCLALMRLSGESDALTALVLDGYGEHADLGEDDVLSASPNRKQHEEEGSDSSAVALISDLYHVHQELKRIEYLRGPGVPHGQGSTTKSRRILLTTVSQLGLTAKRRRIKQRQHAHQGQPTDHDAIAGALDDLFRAPFEVLARPMHPDMDEVMHLYELCETTLDVASFPAEMVRPLFYPSVHHMEPWMLNAVQSLIVAGIAGYSLTTIHPDTYEAQEPLVGQWGRLRAAIFTFLKACSTPDMPSMVGEAAVAIVAAECEAVANIFQTNPATSSSPSCGGIIFNPHVIGEETLPGGGFVMLLGLVLDDALHRLAHGEVPEVNVGTNCREAVLSLHKSKNAVLHVLSSPGDATAMENGGVCVFSDPRPTTAEAWFLSMNSLAKLSSTVVSTAAASNDALYVDALSDLLSDSCAAAVRVFLSKSLKKKKHSKPFIPGHSPTRSATAGEGMTVDAPYVLVMMDFLENYLMLGSRGLALLSSKFREKRQMEFGMLPGANHLPAEFIGGTIIGAALFRIISGGLPPWAVEGVPGLFSALFVACESRTDEFCAVLTYAAELRMSDADGVGCGGIDQGEKVAGPFFEKMSENGVKNFVSKAKKACERNDGEGWRRFKSDMKQICGGKKKAAGFNLKPALSTWDCDRV